jgi:outer membrane murein-binding lipoprotein Lpp
MKWRGSGGWAVGSSYNRMFDSKTIETVKGEIIALDVVAPLKGMSSGVHLMLKTNKEAISIHLGPSWYIENQDVKIGLKDEIEVVGSRVSIQGKSVLIAAEVRKGDEVLRLRDDRGIPYWSGWRRR